MFSLLRWRAVLLLFALVFAAPLLRADNTNGTDRQDIRFKQSAPYSFSTNLVQRFGFNVPFPAYEITNETFHIVVPENLTTNSPIGLLVWISPSDESKLPPDWKPILAKHQLIYACPLRAGNGRDPLDRFRLALDAAFNLCRQYKISREHIFIGGFSGGSRLASMLGVAYSDVFGGTLCVCGVNFYQPIVTPAKEYWPGTYVPVTGMVKLAKSKGKFVLVTGEKDMNRENTKLCAEKGFKATGFKEVFYLEVPGMGHALPPAGYFTQAIEFLTKPDVAALTKQ
jgi:predicted esterase